jgi:myo-inositol-1(or 4)-monophosphatase
MTAGRYEEFATVAAAVAREAGAVLMAGFGRVERVQFKGRINLVTEFDRRSEATIVEALRGRYPDHLIVAEEGGGREGGRQSSPYRWLIDPLDGTTNYAHGNPYFNVSIALQERGETIVGVVYDPVQDELFHAVRGGGARLNGAPLRVSATGDLLHALLTTGFPYRSEHRPGALARWAAFIDAAQQVLCHGAAALDLCGVAAGRFDGYYEAQLEPWDCGAGALIVTEAGGRVTDYHGGPFDPFKGEAVASNGPLHDAMLAVLATVERPV